MRVGRSPTPATLTVGSGEKSAFMKLVRSLPSSPMKMAVATSFASPHLTPPERYSQSTWALPQDALAFVAGPDEGPVPVLVAPHAASATTTVAAMASRPMAPLCFSLLVRISWWVVNGDAAPRRRLSPIRITLSGVLRVSGTYRHGHNRETAAPRRNQPSAAARSRRSSPSRWTNLSSGRNATRAEAPLLLLISGRLPGA